jgi:SAM-dependent methyltransferase
MSTYDPRTPTQRPLTHVELGPGLGDELDRRLIGDVRGKRVLDLGCGGGHTGVGLALRGARVIATDPDPGQLFAARALATNNEIRVEFHEANPAELAFIRADQIDLVVSVWSLSLSDDLDRVLRQVHRVLRAGGHLVLSLPHPATLCADPVDPSRTVTSWRSSDPIGERFVHTAEDVVTALNRTNFGVDLLLERHAGGPMPASLVVRARKVGI